MGYIHPCWRSEAGFGVRNWLSSSKGIPTGEPIVVMTETTFPFRMEIPVGEVDITSELEVSQPGEFWIK